MGFELRFGSTPLTLASPHALRLAARWNGPSTKTGDAQVISSFDEHACLYLLSFCNKPKRHATQYIGMLSVAPGAGHLRP